MSNLHTAIVMPYKALFACYEELLNLWAMQRVAQCVQAEKTKYARPTTTT